MTNNLPVTIAAQFGENHGYRFEGDFVHLNADVMFSDADLATDKAWALQLWASDCGFSGAELGGVKVAELAFEPMVGVLAVAGYCSAMPPAGIADQVLGMALVAYAAERGSEVYDLALYASRESFHQPRMRGDVTCTLADGEAQLAIGAIVNPRAANNLSGTLTLEVWALDAPYGGGSWVGIPVASLVLGVLSGGSEWSASHFTVPAAMPTAGSALTVMLREWTPTGYLTRDYRNVAVAAAKPRGVLAEVPAVETESGVKVQTDAKELPLAVLAKPAKPGKASAEKTTKDVAGPAKKLSKAKSASKMVSINTASEAELIAVKGLSAGVARAIVAARPFAVLGDVCRAKGMGAKLLAKLCDTLTI
jgi:DNA uptake protein ComE-like DNA-binding protein